MALDGGRGRARQSEALLPAAATEPRAAAVAAAACVFPFETSELERARSPWRPRAKTGIENGGKTRSLPPATVDTRSSLASPYYVFLALPPSMLPGAESHDAASAVLCGSENAISGG